MERLRLPLAALALAGLLAAVFVHVAALRGVDVTQAHPALWGLHVGIFVVFLPFVTMLKRTFNRQSRLADMKAVFPSWLLACCFALMVYVGVNFALALVALGGGSPAVRDGQYVLQDHGRLVRVITATEYEAARAQEARLFSGHWIFFYFVPFAFFVYGNPAAPRDGVGVNRMRP